MMTPSTIGRTVASYALSSIFRQGLGVVSAIVRPLFLTPELFGIWNLIKAIPPYASFAHLGARPAARYAIPANEADGNTALNDRIQQTIFTGTLLLNLPFIIGACGWAFIGSDDAPTQFGALMVAAWILLGWYHEHYLTMRKAYQEFNAITRANYVISIMTFLLLPLLWLFSIYGLYASVILAMACGTVILRRGFTPPKGRRFDISLYCRLVQTGAPIMLLTLTILAARTCDRFLIATFIGAEELGYYGIAIMILSFVMNIPTATREVIEPKLMHEIKTLSPQITIQEYFFTPLMTTAYALPIILGPVFFLAPPAVRILLPRYTEGIPCIHILAVGGYFLALVYIARGIIVAKGWQLIAAGIGGLVVIANIIWAFILIKAGFGIEGVATASCMSYLLFFSGLYLLLLTRLRNEISGWGRIFRAVTKPCILMLCSASGLMLAFPTIPNPHIGSQVIEAILQLTLYTGATGGFALLMKRLYPELSHFSIHTLLPRKNKDAS